MSAPFAQKMRIAIVSAAVTSAAWLVAGAVWWDRTSQHTATIVEAPPPPVYQADTLAPPPPAYDADMPALEMPVRAEPGAVPAPGAVSANGLAVPVANVARSDLTDSFTDARSGGERAHEAIDIMAPAGTAVLAAAPGTIEKLFRSDAGGNTIYVRSADRGTIYYYAHLQGYAAGLAEGQEVRQGQRLGRVGSSGNASADAPHLHFAIMRTTPEAKWYDDSTAIDPYPLLREN